MSEERSTDETTDADGVPEGESEERGRPKVDNPFSNVDSSSLRSADTVPTESPTGDDVPFADLAAETRERRRRASERADDDPFEEMDVAALDGEDAWESLDESDGRPALDGAATRVGETDDRPEHVVSKRDYCQQCRHFSDPPAVACERDETDIVEAVDSDRFRVRGCPMVSDDGVPEFDNP